ncbi:type II secretion system protein GspM [Desulfopila sp. IMCC35008]|uniref:type II secretion system protein GspM n=1 Tax=Desulfopila sp. IMCC35008 TaxID=2653858 RepID=UPI0013D130D0|nr:type II secretion system protein GspM [Desulfopila sp. IMCC35008]
MKRLRIPEKTLAGIRARSGIDQLGQREKVTLAVGVFFVIGVLIFHFMISPYFENRERLQKSIERKQKDLLEMRLLQQEYGELRKQEGGIKTNLARRQKGFTLFTFLDQQAAAADVKQQIKYMKPSVVEGDDEFSESLVEMKLQEVDLPHLVRFLRGIESDVNVVSVRRISIQASSKEQGMLDVILQVVTFTEAG